MRLAGNRETKQQTKDTEALLKACHWRGHVQEQFKRVETASAVVVRAMASSAENGS
jgi:hypothetical protein